MSRAMAAYTEGVEKQLGRRLSGVELVPFESNIPGTMKWKVTDFERGGQRGVFTTVVWADFPTREWLLQLEVHGTGDNDGLARRVLRAGGGLRGGRDTARDLG
jgi:hypothetical protein